MPVIVTVPSWEEAQRMGWLKNQIGWYWVQNQRLSPSPFFYLVVFLYFASCCCSHLSEELGDGAHLLMSCYLFLPLAPNPCLSLPQIMAYHVKIKK